MNGEELLGILPSKSVKVAFFDPQYRGVLDKMSYGNEGKNRGQVRSSLPQMDEDTIGRFIVEIERILMPNGYLFLWVDKFHLLEGVKPWLESTPSLAIVDMLTWDKGRIGMGYRSRRRSEYLVVMQKYPRQAKSTWTIRNIPDVWCEKLEGKSHTHSKPIGLQMQLILATTNEGDLVLDPASGGFSVFEACKMLGRNFIGCDLVFGEVECK
ncbi:MAG: DNA methyltransferase [Wolinella sp.]